MRVERRMEMEGRGAGPGVAVDERVQQRAMRFLIDGKGGNMVAEGKRNKPAATGTPRDLDIRKSRRQLA